MAFFFKVWACRNDPSLCRWWLELQLLIKCSIHFSERAIKVLHCEHLSSALVRACQRCCRCAVHFWETETDWSFGSSQLTQSLLSGSGSKWTEERLSLIRTQCIQGLNWNFFSFFLLLVFIEACLCPPMIFSFCIHVLSSSQAADDLQQQSSPIDLLLCSVWRSWS